MYAGVFPECTRGSEHGRCGTWRCSASGNRRVNGSLSDVLRQCYGPLSGLLLEYQACDGRAIKRNWSVAERLPELFGNGAGLLSQTDSGTGVLHECYKIPTGVPRGVLWGNVTPALRNRHRSDAGKVLAGHEKGSGSIQNETEMVCGAVVLQ